VINKAGHRQPLLRLRLSAPRDRGACDGETPPRTDEAAKRECVTAKSDLRADLLFLITSPQ
jgi:hypothetical protein